MKRFDGGVSVVGGHDSEGLMEELSSGGAEAEGGLARMAKRSKAPLETSLGMSVDEEVLITEIGTGGRAHDTRAREREWEKSIDMINAVCYSCSKRFIEKEEGIDVTEVPPPHEPCSCCTYTACTYLHRQVWLCLPRLRCACWQE